MRPGGGGGGGSPQTLNNMSSLTGHSVASSQRRLSDCLFRQQCRHGPGMSHTALDDRDLNNGCANTSGKGMGAEVETLGVAGRRCITDVDYVERIQSQSSSAHHRNLT